MVPEVVRYLFANFKVDDKPLQAFFCAELLSLHTGLLILEEHSPETTTWPISAHFTHGTAISVVPQLSPVVFTCSLSRYFEASGKDLLPWEFIKIHLKNGLNMHTHSTLPLTFFSCVPALQKI